MNFLYVEELLFRLNRSLDRLKIDLSLCEGILKMLLDGLCEKELIWEILTVLTMDL